MWRVIGFGASGRPSRLRRGDFPSPVAGVPRNPGGTRAAIDDLSGNA
jgi:hypothetical protein